MIVVDNASGDHTQQVLARDDLPLQVIRSEENVGGAGGFRIGMETAYAGGWDRIWLMDDDVVPAPDCLAVLMARRPRALRLPDVRARGPRGPLVEKSATTFDLRNPLAIKPKTASVETTYGTRAAMPPLVEIEVVAFEGLLVRREVVARRRAARPGVLHLLRRRGLRPAGPQAGFRIWAVRDAVLVRQLPFSQQHALETWKGFYMYRNLFVVHFRHGENALVRAKPYAITAAVVALSPLRGGRAEAGNVIRAIRGAGPCSEGTRTARGIGAGTHAWLDSTGLSARYSSPRELFEESTPGQESPTCPTSPTSSSSAAGSSASPSPSAAPASSG